MTKGIDNADVLIEQLVGGLPDRVRDCVSNSIRIILACDSDVGFRMIAKSMTPAERLEVQGLLEGVKKRLSRVKDPAVTEPTTTSPETKALRTSTFAEFCRLLAGHFEVSPSCVERGLKFSAGIDTGSWEIVAEEDDKVVVHSKVPKGAPSYVEYHITMTDGIVEAKHIQGNNMLGKTERVRRIFCMGDNVNSLGSLLGRVTKFFGMERGDVERGFSSLGINAKSGWQFEPTRSGAIIRNGSSSYKLSAESSESKDVLVVENLEKGIPAESSLRRGWGPDRDEPFAGVHPADEE